jgi:hypothetical protein
VSTLRLQPYAPEPILRPVWALAGSHLRARHPSRLRDAELCGHGCNEGALTPETPSCEWCNGHPDFNGPHGNGACAPYRAVALPVSGTEPTPEHTRLLADAMTTRYPAAPAPVSPDIGVLIDEYREACAFATEAGINLPTKAAGAVNAQINARIALDAAVASLVERVERAERKEVTAVRYREITGCAHAIHEECPRCICPTCGTRAVQSRELGWLPFSERLAALTPTPETSPNG